MFEHTSEIVPLLFVDKQIVSVTIQQGMIATGSDGLTASYCEIYASKGWITHVRLVLF